MATFTITTAQNIDALSVKAGGDTYNVNGGTLTIDQDSRVGLNQTTSTSLGPVTISATLGGTVNIDGTLVRLIPYNTGSGTVPAWNTVITQGSASGKLIGVYSSLTAASTATGAAMPASGYIKIKQWNSVAYAAGALTGITATATGADVVGWLDIVGDEAGTTTANRLGIYNITGEWFELGTTSGVSNQTLQIPNSGLLRYAAGVFIEKTVGGEDFEFYPNAGTTTTTGTEAKRGKVVWIDNTGLVRIGNSGAATNGYTPVSGLRVVIGNVFFENCTTAARTANVIPNATIATRYDYTTTGGGVLNIDKCNMAWYLSCSQAYSVNVSNSGFVDAILLSEIAAPMTFENVGVGNKPTTALLVSPLTMTYCYAGGTFTDCVWARVSLAASNAVTAVFTDIDGFTFTRNTIRANTIRGNASTYALLATRAKNVTLDTPTIIEGALNLVTCDNFNTTNVEFVSAVSGTTVTTYTDYVWNLSSNTINCTFSGLTLPVTSNAPYTALLIGATGCANIKLRNIGTYASPLSLDNGANDTGLIYTLATNCQDFYFQRIYVSNTRTNTMTADNSCKNIVEKNVFGDYADAPLAAVLNLTRLGGGSTNALTAQTSVYGTHFMDYFTSTTAGRLGIVMNEPTADTTAQVTLSNGAAFTSAGGLYMPVIGMQVIYEMPQYIIGHTQFANTALVMAGGTATNYTYQYSIDLNDGNGFSAFSSDCTPTTLGTALNGLTLDAQVGFKLKLKITTSTTNATAITSVYMTTVSTTTAQAYQYPLDPVDAIYSFSGLVVGTEVVLFDSTNTELAREVITGTTFEYSYTWTGTDSTGNYALIWKDDQVAIKFTGITLGNTDVDVPISQTEDLVYTTGFTPNSTIDFANSLIIMDDVLPFTVPEVYSYWKDTLLLTNNAQYDFAYTIVGGNQTGASTYIPFYTFLDNGWKVRPNESDYTLNVTGGILVTTDNSDPFVDTVGAYTVRIRYEQPVQAIAITTGGGGGATAADVWSYTTRTLSTAGVTAIQSGLATEANATSNTNSIIAIINALNDISPSEVLTQATNALISYDPPTKAELDATQASIEADIAAINTPDMLNTETGDIILPL